MIYTVSRWKMWPIEWKPSEHLRSTGTDVNLPDGCYPELLYLTTASANRLLKDANIRMPNTSELLSQSQKLL
jgi:hypothetical protein